MRITRTRVVRAGIKAVVAVVSLVAWVGAMPALAQRPTIIDLNVPFGTESSPVARILGADAGAVAPLPAASPHDRRKNRVISINPNNIEPIVMRVELLDRACSTSGAKCTNDVDCDAGETCEDQNAPIMLGWVSAPITLSAASQLPQGTIVTRVQEEMPEPRVWSATVVHVSDCEIAPVQSYGISASADGATFSEPLRIGTIKKPGGKNWADYVASAAGGVFTPPNEITADCDLGAILYFFQGRVVSDPEYVVTTLELAGEETTFVIGVAELQEWLRAFGGGTYPPPSFVAQTPSDCVDPGLCGDGSLGLGEQCDDGNTDPGDGCGAFCQIEGTGDRLIEFVPTGSTGDFTITGRHLFIPSGGVQVEFEIRISRWGGATNDTLLGAYGATFDASGLLGSNATPPNPGVDLRTPNPVDCFEDEDCPSPSPPPVTALGSCGVFEGGRCDDSQAGFIIVNRCRGAESVICQTRLNCPPEADFCVEDTAFVLSHQGLSPVVAVSIPANDNIEWIASAAHRGASDDGTSKSAGFLRLIVPPDAKGTYTIGFNPHPEKTVLTDDAGNPLPGITLVNGAVTIETCVADIECADPIGNAADNLCTSNRCDQTTALCGNVPLFVATVDCCDPAVGAGGGLTRIDDADGCTVDTCDPATGVVEHDIVAAGGMSCDDGFACTVDDTCDGAKAAADGGCVGTEANTIECETTDDCQVGACNPATGLCDCAEVLVAASPHDRLKNRVISINPNHIEPIVMKVELLDRACSTSGAKCTNDVDCDSGETCDDQSAPIMLGWVSDPITLGAPSQLPAGSTVARVVKDMPAFRVWSETIVHVSDCEIAPAQGYSISASPDGLIFSEPLRIGTTTRPEGKDWADYVSTAAGGVFTPPNGILNVDDLSALLAFFQGRTVSDLEYVVTTLELVDETTTFVISASDLQAWLGAFGGGQYPPPSYPNQGGPADCP